MYIQCCQQLEGYGEERFQAKDNLSNDINLGLAINGMVVTAENGRQYFPWKDFHTVTIDKRTIRIEQNKADGTLFVGSFIFSEADTARYFWKLCITQHKFFKRYIDEDSSSMGDVESANGISIGGGAEGMNASAYSGYDLSDSREDLLLEHRAIYVPGANNSVTIGGGGGNGGGYQQASQQQTQEYLSSAQSLHHQSNSQLPPPHGMITSANSSSALMSSNISLAASHQSGSGRADNNGGINGSALHMGGGGGGHHGGGGQLGGQSWLSKVSS